MAAILNERSQYVDAGGKPLFGGKIFIGKVGLDPVLNPEDIFANPELTTPLANPQTINPLGMSTNQIYVSGRYSIKIESAAGIQHQQSLTVGTEPGSAGPILLSNVSGTNAINAQASPPITEYVNGQEYRLQVLTANTAQMSLDIDLVGPKNITDSLRGLVFAGQWISLYFNSTNDDFDQDSRRNLASPAAIGNETPNLIDGTTIKATVEFDGVLGTTTPRAIKGTTIEATTSIKGNAGQAITQFDNNGSLSADSTTRGVTQNAVKAYALQKDVNAVGQGDIASGAVGRAELKTTTVSLAGTITGNLKTNIILTGGGYVFFPMIHSSSTNTTVALSGHSTDGNSADAPRLAFVNSAAPSATYDIDYRYVQA